MTTKKKLILPKTIEELFKDPDESKYENLMNDITNFITADISRRHILVNISFNGKQQKKINLGQYLVYLIILQPFFVYDETIQVDKLPDVSNINEIEKYFDFCIDYFGIQLNNIDNIGEVLVDIIDRLNSITCEMNKKFGPTFDLLTFIELADRNKEFAKILYEPGSFIKENNGKVSPEEIVKHTHQIIKDVQRCIIEDDQNYFKNFITSGAGVNAKQLGQVVGYIGLKPDLKEKIIPKPIDTNFCLGLRNITDYYINAVGCLKALITVKIQTKNSGYLTRKIEILLNDEFIADIDDCGTQHLLPFTINDKNNLIHSNNLYYSLKENGSNLKKIHGNDTDLIGKTIYLRTPLTCACKEGICKKCYGDMYKFNENMNIGLIAALIITNMMTQTNLSVKHLLQAIVLVTLRPELLKYFTVEINKLSIKDEYIDKISLAFNRDIDFDVDSEGENKYQVRTINIVDNDELIEIENNILFDINPELNDLLTSELDQDLDKYIIKGKKLKNLDYIFEYSVDNNSLSGPMLKLKELIEKNDFIKSHNAFELFYKVIETLQEGNSKTDYIHIAVLIKNLMKVNRELFKEKEFPEVTMYSVPDAILYNSKSVSKPLLFERIKDQLLLDKYNTLKKDGWSNYDTLLK